MEKDALILYVRAHSIVGVAYLEGTPRRLTLPNGESAVGLYFYEDIENKSISYGSAYRRGYEDKQPRYHGNILPLLWDEDNTYEYCGVSCEMKTILRDARIWRDLADAYNVLAEHGEQRKPVPLYVSFHPELQDVDKLSFVKLLKAASEFDLRSYGATIETLSLATFLQEEGIVCPKAPRYVLFLQALSSDLYLSVVNMGSEEGVLKQTVLSQRGRDYRKAALVESIVENINRTTHLLNSDEEIREIARLSHLHAEEWIARLDKSPIGFPIKFEEICFAVAPHNKYSATIQPSQIEERTARTVEQVTHEIVSFARESLPKGALYSYIIMLGDTCSNSNYRKNLSAKLSVTEDRIMVYTEAELPYRLPSYPSLKLEMLRPIEVSIEEKGKEELSELEDQKKERITQGTGNEELSRGERTRLEQEYKAAYDRGCELLEKGDYRGASDFFRKALEKKPGDKIAQTKLGEAGQLEAKEQIQQQQYDTFLHEAQTMEQKGDLEAALASYRAALSMNPDSEYAVKRLSKIERKLKTEQKAQSFYDKARAFFEARAFASARVELEKIKLLLSPNAPLLSESKTLLQQITQEENNLKLREAEVCTLREKYLAHKLESKLEEALSFLKRLVEIDQDNTSHWLSELTFLKEAIGQEREHREKASRLLKKANALAWEESYTSAIGIAEEVLQMGESQEARELLARCRRKLEQQQEDEKNKSSHRPICTVKENRTENLSKQDVSALCQCYLFLIEDACKGEPCDRRPKEAAGYFSKMVELNIPQDEHKLWDNLQWKAVRVFGAFSEKSDFQGVYDFVQTLKRLPYLPRPSKAHSALLRPLLKLVDTNENNPRTALELLDWWNPRYLRPEDYNNAEKADEKGDHNRHSAPAEMLLNRYADLLGKLKSTHRDRIERFVPFLKGIIDTHPNFVRCSYHYTKLLLLLDSPDKKSI